MSSRETGKREKEEAIELEGIVTQVLPNAMFRVDVTSHIVLARLAGRLHRKRIRVVLHDRVRVEVSPYDPRRGRIVWRCPERPAAGAPGPRESAQPPSGRHAH